MIKDYKNLTVWKKSVQLVVSVYKFTKNFPPEEKFGLTSQVRRAAISIPSNIAEGKLRGSDQEFRRFLFIAFSSGGELETQLVIARQLEETKNLDYTEVDDLLNEIMKMLNTLITKLGASS